MQLPERPPCGQHLATPRFMSGHEQSPVNRIRKYSPSDSLLTIQMFLGISRPSSPKDIPPAHSPCSVEADSDLPRSAPLRSRPAGPLGARNGLTRCARFSQWPSFWRPSPREAAEDTPATAGLSRDRPECPQTTGETSKGPKQSA